MNPMDEVNRRLQKDMQERREVIDQIIENKRKAEQVQIEQRDYLKEISADMKGLSEVIELVRRNNEINERTFQLVLEVFTVITADSPEQANDIIRNTLDKANQTNEDWGTIQTIIGYGKMLGKLTFPDSGLFD
ncbi:hypothetical protein ABEY41_19090 [Peribacillus butanolivorans]|uniref:hypothetical protein n=1 Tax=Peribacillus butanolivorans TaxID=421767 RepID=UPI003D28280B